PPPIPPHLTFDDPSPLNFHIYLEDDDPEPRIARSDFQLADYRFLSSSTGERWAMVNVYNPLKSSRRLRADQIQATFFNGEKKHPRQLDKFIRGERTLTLFINFGRHSLPLHSLEVRNR
ncbi:MAG: hypothetical protein AAGB46_20195, partial [Verrucomicrobiota bacterium]